MSHNVRCLNRRPEDDHSWLYRITSNANFLDINHSDSIALVQAGGRSIILGRAVGLGTGITSPVSFPPHLCHVPGGGPAVMTARGPSSPFGPNAAAEAARPSVPLRAAAEVAVPALPCVAAAGATGPAEETACYIKRLRHHC